MTIKEIIDIASKGYPDNLVESAYSSKANPGDTLALFISCELEETFDSEACSLIQLDDAINAMERAREEISNVISSLESVRADTHQIENTPSNELPLLIGHLSTEEGNDLLTKRLRNK